MSRFIEFVTEDKFNIDAGWVTGSPEEYATDNSEDENFELKWPEGMEVENIERHGGEGEGDEAWAVYLVTDNGVAKYYRCNGSYASYDGFYFEGDVEEVQPYNKTVTDWAVVK